ncbi:flavin reductase family protein [Amycolatopsis japonica]
MVIALSPEQAAFRAAMRRVCSSVSVMTSFDGERPHGTTISAFCSLSMTPPMLLVALDERSELLAMVRRTGTFGVNVLSAGQSRIATRFAAKGSDKFDGVEWSSEHGAVRLPSVASWVACLVRTIAPGGDHFVLLGEVVAAESTEAPPLTYYAGSFGTHREEARR